MDEDNMYDYTFCNECDADISECLECPFNPNNGWEDD